MSKAQVIRTLASAKKIYERRVAEYLGDMKLIEQNIDAEIRRVTNQLVWHSLGLEYYYGHIRISDNYRDRERQAPLIKFVEEKATAAAKKWITEIVKGDFMPKLSTYGEREVRAGYMETYLKELKRALQKIAVKRAEEDAERIAKILAQSELPLDVLMKNLSSKPEPEDEEGFIDEDENADGFDDNGRFNNEDQVKRMEKMFVNTAPKK